MSIFDFKSIEPQLRQRSIFTYWLDERVRFSDTDMMGHVNNTAYAAFCESGRVSFNRAAVPGFIGGHGMVARVAINYLGETNFPAIVDVGTGVVAIGNSSYTLAQGLFVENRCVATSEAVLVRINPETRRPAPIPEEMRAQLHAVLLPFSAASAG
jgi:acyl-CoA thioester hydrolase